MRHDGRTKGREKLYWAMIAFAWSLWLETIHRSWLAESPPDTQERQRENLGEGGSKRQKKARIQRAQNESCAFPQPVEVQPGRPTVPLLGVLPKVEDESAAEPVMRPTPTAATEEEELDVEPKLHEEVTRQWLSIADLWNLQRSSIAGQEQ